MTWLRGAYLFTIICFLQTTLVFSFTSNKVNRLWIPQKNTKNCSYGSRSQPYCPPRRQNGHDRLIMNQKNFSLKAKNDEISGFDSNYLVNDSLDLENRPTVWDTLNNPRDLLALGLVGVGLIVSVCNVFGIYSKNVYLPLEYVSIGIGLASTFATFLQIVTGYNVVPETDRRGLVNDLYLNIYAACYSLAVSWLALRTSNITVPGIHIQSYDGILPWIMATIFLLSGVTPALTLWTPFGIWSESPELSETEKVRSRGLVAIGVLACVFLPDSLAFGFDSISSGGNGNWWNRISTLYPSQPILESSTALFALYANEASMILHRLAKAGAKTFRFIVPVGVVACLVLAIVPCVCALYWLGDDISFFSFYTD